MTDTLQIKYSLKDTLVPQDTLLFFVGKSNDTNYCLYLENHDYTLKLYIMYHNQFILKDSIYVSPHYPYPNLIKVEDLDNDGIMDIIYQVDSDTHFQKVYAIVSIKLSPQPKLVELTPWLTNPKYLPKENLIVGEGYNRRNFLISKEYYSIQNNTLVLVKQEHFKDPEDED